MLVEFGIYGVGASMRVEYTELVLTADVPFYAILALLLTGFAWHLNIPETNFYAMLASFKKSLCLTLIQALIQALI